MTAPAPVDRVLRTDEEIAAAGAQAAGAIELTDQQCEHLAACLAEPPQDKTGRAA